jgi:hypothetical protein
MENGLFLSDFSEKLSIRLQQVENRHQYLSYLIEKRLANEKLLHLETMNIISHNPRVVDYLPERLYGLEEKGKCDFWFKMEDRTEFWMEIKTRPTNYRKPGHAKAITNGVDQVIDDIKRLKGVTGNNVQRLMLFAFYPLYPESYSTFHTAHLKRIFGEIGKAPESPRIKISIGEADFNVYLTQV